MRIRYCSFLIGLATLGACVQLASAAPVLWSTAPDSSGRYSLERIDVAAKTVTPVFPLGNNQVACNGGLTFDSATGLFNALFSESDDSATFVTFTKDGGGALTGLYKPGFGFHGGLAFASTLNDDYGIASAQDGSSTLFLLPTRAGETIRFAAALGSGYNGGLTFDPLNGEFYAISNDSAGRSTLERIDLASGTVTPVGVSLGFGFTGGLAFDPSSNLLYAIGSDNSGFSTLFSFNTDASGIKAVFPLGFGFNGASLTLGPSSDPTASTPEQREQAALSEVTRINEMMEGMIERMKYAPVTNPGEMMELCQDTLPKLDDAFRVLMTYADANQKAQVQHSYIATRQMTLDNLVLAQRRLAEPVSP